MRRVEVFLGHKISYCPFWDEGVFLVFWPKEEGGKDCVYPEKFKTIEEARQFIREHDDNPDNYVLKYLQD